MKYLPPQKVVTGHIGYQQQVKEANIKRIFDLVRDNKCGSRAEIVRYMNLSATSVSVLVEELATRKLVDEVGPAQTTQPGRRPIGLRLNRDAHQMAVFSISREGVRYALLNLECHILETRFHPLDAASITEEDRGEAYTKVFDEVLRQHSRRFKPSRAVMVGISFPGTYIERDHQFFTTPALGFPISEASIRRFQQRCGLPVYLLSSTRSMAYAEKKHLDAANSEAADIDDLLLVRIHEGISCAILSHGDLYVGPYNVSGEIGHATIDYQGRPCRCGNRGCLERYVNLDLILEDAQQAARDAGLEPPATLAELANRYPGEPALLEAVRRSARLLSFGLYTVMCTSGKRRIVLSGGIEVLGEPFLEEIRRALCDRAMLVRHLDLSYAQAGPDAEIVGIAHHFLDKVFTITG